MVIPYKHIQNYISRKTALKFNKFLISYYENV